MILMVGMDLPTKRSDLGLSVCICGREFVATPPDIGVDYDPLQLNEPIRIDQ